MRSIDKPPGEGQADGRGEALKIRRQYLIRVETFPVQSACECVH